MTPLKVKDEVSPIYLNWVRFRHRRINALTWVLSNERPRMLLPSSWLLLYDDVFLAKLGHFCLAEPEKFPQDVIVVFSQ